MKKIILIFFFFYLCFFSLPKCHSESLLEHNIFVVIQVRNKAHVLPYFLTIFENLNYPKDKISLYIQSDHNSDRTVEVLSLWLAVHQQEYHSVIKKLDSSSSFYPDEYNEVSWSEDRFINIIYQKEKGLEKARSMRADYVWFLDPDVFLVTPDILQKLIEMDKPVVAPMLKSATSYSNFWTGETNEVYKHDEREIYDLITTQELRGCYSVYLVKECVLVDLNKVETESLTFNPNKISDYEGPKVDMDVFAYGAKINNVTSYICNEEDYGYILEPLFEIDDYTQDFLKLSELKIRIALSHEPLFVSPLLSIFIESLPEVDNLGFDRIYVINLPRREDRKQRMISNLREHGLIGTYFPAFDWKDLNASFIESIGAKPLEAFDDEKMTYGTISNFLSHSSVWQDIIDNNYKKAIILEDDFQFNYFFRKDVQNMMDEIKQLELAWDFIYLERNEQLPDEVTEVEGSDYLVNPSYSWSAAAYILTLEGAEKLLKPNPIANLLPTDVYLPVMFDKCPFEHWKEPFETRDLKAFSINPLVGSQYHYSYQNGFMSDTFSAPEIGDMDFELSEEFLTSQSIESLNEDLSMTLI